MALNEKIAEVIWPDRHFPHGYHTFDPAEHCKLLQQKMVDDGWNIFMRISKSENVLKLRAEKWVDGYAVDKTVRFGSNTEPAAIVALFIKVYGLEV